MIKNIKVSIVLPVYNGEKYLKEAIDSCLNQTYKNIQLIIVNDGSTDNSEEIINSYKDKRIIYIKNDNNQNLPAALNIGFSNADGDFLTWTSHDNIYSQEAIETLLSYATKNKCDFVYADYYIFENENLNNLKLKDLSKTNIKNGDFIGPCFLYSKKVKEMIGNYDEALFTAEDYDYWLRISKIFSFNHINKPLYYYRLHPLSLTYKKSTQVDIITAIVWLKNKIKKIDEITEYILNAFYQLNKKERNKFSKVLKNFFLRKKIKRSLKEYLSNKVSEKETIEKIKGIIGDVDNSYGKNENRLCYTRL